MDEKQSISTAELREFSEVLTGIGQVYKALADWLDKHSVSEIPGGGTPTVKRAMGYLGGFTGAVLKAYAISRVQGRASAGGKPLPADYEIVGALANAEAHAKYSARRRTSPDATAPGLTPDAAYEKHASREPRRKREKK